MRTDIRKNGLKSGVSSFAATEPAQKFLLDGRNRLDALALIGWLGPKRGDGPLKIQISPLLTPVKHGDSGHRPNIRSDDPLSPWHFRNICIAGI